MKLRYFATATAAVALLGGAAFAQQPHATDHAKPAGEQPYGAETTTDAQSSAEGAAGASISTDGATADTTAAGDVTAGATAETAPAAGSFAQGASVTTTLVTNGPVPDTPENRDKYGGPNSRAGKMTDPAGN